MVTGTIRKTDEYPKQFVMIKNAVGGLTVKTEAFDFSVPARNIVFKFDQDRNYLMTNYALGVFVTPSALKQMELGYFTFENLDTLIKMAENAGIYVPDSIKDPKVTLKDIAKALRSGDQVELDKLTKNLNRKTRNDIIVTAQKMYNNLQQGVILHLEKKLGVSLKPIDLSE